MVRLLRGDGISPRSLVYRTGIPKASYTIHEIVDLGQIVCAVTPVFGAYQFAFSDLTNTSAWQGLFDRYRFLSVRVTFAPVGVQVNTTPSVDSIPEFGSIVDFDDATAPPSLAQMKRCAAFVGHSSTVAMVRHFLPRPSTAVYNGMTTGYGETPAYNWLDLGYPGIPHFGVKYGLGAATPAGQAAIYTVQAEYIIEVAGQRG